MARSTPRQTFKESEERPTLKGRPFDGFVEYRDKDTFEVVQESPFNHNVYKFMFRKHVEEWAEIPSDPESMTVGQWEDGIRTFTYYTVVRRSNKGTETIGQITAHTTEERLKSMFYRYFNEGHAKACSFDGSVVYSGSKSNFKEGDSARSKMPYVAIPGNVVEDNDLVVDDEVRITITNSCGVEFTDRYHLSKLTADDLGTDKGILVVPLVGFKRLVYFDNPDTGLPEVVRVTTNTFNSFVKAQAEGRQITIVQKYKVKPTASERKKGKRTEVRTRELPCFLFIPSGEEVHIDLIPQEYTVNPWGRMGRFDFAKESLLVIKRAQARMKKYLESGMR